ncbi:aldolase [Metabacillus sediminilitoris]|uniref:Aldolase n=1 Tax=Metabacillus sediminilitoris TaxID=2567941 RepID=A0A4S4BZ60_9BACI|nr:aldolase [Metabacillus sediminilitoris]QGQ47211.1 aldolase [Metabacillus sediminilitoris]THF80555.1 aldolase [Metabacillus sediminilitoris]
MDKTAKGITYKAFGLSIYSYFHLPELNQVTIQDDEVDIVIENDDLSKLWLEQVKENEYFFVKKNFILFRVPDVAIFLVKNGKEIIVSPIRTIDEQQIRLYILGTCMGAILLQRNILPLHGSAIAIDGKAYAIVGDSGAGKSTLASALLDKGYKLISDDVIPISFLGNHIPVVTPTYPQQKLWLESLNQFGMESKEFQPIVLRDTKFAIPVAHQFASNQLPLAGIFELVKNEHDEIAIQSIEKLQRLHTLFKHTYRNSFIIRSGLMQWHFHTTTNIVNKISFYQLCRPTVRFTAHELSDLILSTIKGEEKVI